MSADARYIDEEHFASLLKRLRLTAWSENLDNLLEEASREKLNYRELVYLLCRAEAKRRDASRIRMGMTIARFPCVRTLEDFDWDAQPSLERAKIEELRACRWVSGGETLLFLGPPGVGKTHLAIALGREAIERGYSVLFTTASALLTQLSRAQQENRLDERLSHFGKPKLLIIDELGYLPLTTGAAHLFFQLVSKRYEHGSVLITSNRSVGEWGEVFGDAVVAAAILDRLLHHSHVVTIRGESYRLLEKRRSGLLLKRAEGGDVNTKTTG
jgi:DNA replication protein DnaC